MNACRKYCAVLLPLLLLACGDPPVDDEGDTTSAIEFGTNEPYQSSPDGFTIIEDGDVLDIVEGTQLAHMVVLAFRTKNLVEVPVDVVAAIEVDGNTVGDIIRVNRPLILAVDGWYYYYNLFLQIVDWQPLIGDQGILHFRVTDSTGADFDFTANVGFRDGGSVLGG